jgi:hypothetical protein
LNSNNEIFVGNYIEGFGSSYTYGATGFTISDTVGYYNTNGGTLLDLIVYSTHSGTTFTPYNVTFNVSCPDFVPCEAPITGNTYVRNSTVNVTSFSNGCSGGYIRYDTPNGTVDKFISSTGIYTITDCIVFSSIRPAFPFFCIANWTTTVSGTTCSDPTSGNVNITFTTGILNNASTIVYWVDGYGTQQSRFMSNSSTFTTCGIYGSASGAFISYGSTCTPTPDPTPTINWYQFNISFLSYSDCNDTCDETNLATQVIYSHAEYVGQLLVYGVFSDTNGTPFVGNGNFYKVTKTGDAGYGYSVKIDEYGVVDIRQCTNDNPGMCGPSL